MDNHHPRVAPDPRDRARAHFAYGIWLRVGFVGFSGLVAGVVSLFEHHGAPVNALAMAIAGGVLGAWSWHRATVMLDRIDAVDVECRVASTHDGTMRTPAAVTTK